MSTSGIKKGSLADKLTTIIAFVFVGMTLLMRQCSIGEDPQSTLSNDYIPRKAIEWHRVRTEVNSLRADTSLCEAFTACNKIDEKIDKVREKFDKKLVDILDDYEDDYARVELNKRSRQKLINLLDKLQVEESSITTRAYVKSVKSLIRSINSYYRPMLE